MNSTITMQEDWTFGHSLHFYKVLYYCTSFIPAGVGFFVFPSLALILHCCLCPLIDENPRERNVAPDLIGCQLKDSCNESQLCTKTRLNCICNINCRCTNALLSLTIGTSQFLFGSTTIKLRDKISYKKRCIKIGRRYYKLSLWTLLPLVWSNACVLASLTAVFCGFFVIKETTNCDERIDCFIADESDTRRITDCALFDEQRIKVKCYELSSLMVLYALSFIGGLLKFVPIIFKAVILLYLSDCEGCTCNCKYRNYYLLCVNYTVILILLTIGFGSSLALLFMSPQKFNFLRTPFFVFVQMNMKRLGLFMSIIAQCGSIFLYPWFTLRRQVITQAELKVSPNNNHDDQNGKEDSYAIISMSDSDIDRLLRAE